VEAQTLGAYKMSAYEEDYIFQNLTVISRSGEDHTAVSRVIIAIIISVRRIGDPSANLSHAQK